MPAPCSGLLRGLFFLDPSTHCNNSERLARQADRTASPLRRASLSVVFDLLTSSMQRKSRVRISLHSRSNTLPSLITFDVDPLRFHTKISELFAKLASGNCGG